MRRDSGSIKVGVEDQHPRMSPDLCMHTHGSYVHMCVHTYTQRERQRERIKYKTKQKQKVSSGWQGGPDGEDEILETSLRIHSVYALYFYCT